MRDFFTILGGMGTMATETFVHILNEKTPAHNDQEYLNYLVVNDASIPDRTAFILNKSQADPRIALLEDIEQQSLLKPNFFVLTCNTAHYFYNDLQAATNIPIVHMPREVAKAIKTTMPNVKKVGIMATTGTLAAGIYQKEIEAVGLQAYEPSAELKYQVMELIYQDIKANNHYDYDKFHHLIQAIINEGDCDVVVLGCTELSVAQLQTPVTDLPVIDSETVLVDRVLRLMHKA